MVNPLKSKIRFLFIDVNQEIMIQYEQLNIQILTENTDKYFYNIGVTKCLYGRIPKRKGCYLYNILTYIIKKANN